MRMFEIGAVLHSAASVRFHGGDTTDEYIAMNVGNSVGRSHMSVSMPPTCMHRSTGMAVDVTALRPQAS